MSSLLSSLGIDKLSADDRLRLVEVILDSLGEQRQLAPITESQRQELNRRLADLEKGIATLSQWDEVEARIMRSLCNDK